MKIYLDVCCLNRPFDDQSDDRIHLESVAVLHILEICQTGGRIVLREVKENKIEQLHIKNFELSEWILVGSDVIDIEISKIPDDEQRQKVYDLASISKSKIAINNDIIKDAKKIEKLGFKSFDALHIACAKRGADIFLTTDYDVLKKIKNNSKIINIRGKNPLMWLFEMVKKREKK